MKILSLFDWISCGYVALQRAWIPIDKYYASEIDEYAIKVATTRHPDIEEIWNVCNVHYTNGYLSTYEEKEWWWNTTTNIATWKIDLVIGWSPCQGFSMAGKMLNFEDPRSKLFFEFVRIVNEVKPKFFLLENVKMKKDFIKVISEQLWNIEPVLIDSALLSAQSRKRLYWIWELQEDWTYKKVDIPQPEDKGIFLKDILEDNVDEKYFISQTQVERIKKWKSYQNPLDRILTQESKCPTLTARGAGEYHSGMILVDDKEIPLPCATQLGNWYWEGYNNCFGNNKAYTLRANQPNWVIVWDKDIRKLTPIECERLQTLEDWYTDVWISDTQRYKQLWNWWNVDTIAHIFSHLPINNG